MDENVSMAIYNLETNKACLWQLRQNNMQILSNIIML